MILPEPDADPLHAAIRASLLPPAGKKADAAFVTGIILVTLCRMNAQLVPVIGSRGMDALYYRSLHLTSSAYPWLGTAGDRRPAGDTYQPLKMCLEAQAGEVATEAGFALLSHFIRLLAGLIGESLTRRLLSPVWTHTPEKIQENDHAQ